MSCLVKRTRPDQFGLVVSPKTNLWHCPGACNVGGSTIDWVMRTKGVSPAYGGVAAGRSSVFSCWRLACREEAKHGEARTEAPVSSDADHRDALKQVVEFYRSVESRGLTHPELLERFQIGFSNRTLVCRCRTRIARKARNCADGCRRPASFASAGMSTS